MATNPLGFTLSSLKLGSFSSLFASYPFFFQVEGSFPFLLFLGVQCSSLKHTPQPRLKEALAS